MMPFGTMLLTDLMNLSTRKPAAGVVKPFNMTRWFSWLSLASIMAVCAASSVLLSSFLTQHFLRHDADLTTVFLQSVADRAHTPAYASGGQPMLKAADFEDFFRNTAVPWGILRANIYAPDRRLIWTSDHKLAGQQFDQNPGLERALAGEISIEVGIAGEHDPKPERVFLSDKPVRFVEIYMPIRNRDSGEVIGVAEIYREPRELFETIVRGTRLIWLLAALGGALLFAVLLWIVRRADKTIGEQHQRLLESETLAAVGELGSAVAHGIRNPLASIRTSAELCADEESCPARQSSLDIIAEVDRLERWVRRLLTYSHPDKGEPTSVDLCTVIALAEEQFRRECGKRNIALRLDLPQGLPAVAGDEPLLEQVFYSLFANAIEAMPAGGVLTVAVALEGEGRRVVVAIDDTGHGIAPEQLSRLFTPFATTKPHGMGLGLALVRRIIRRFGGNVRVENRADQGTRVTLDLIAAA
jgi:two-component system sensor histidine kinase HydH